MTMNTKTKTETVIGLWFDDVSGDDLWIVSLDTMNEKGQADETDTLGTSEDFGEARDSAIEEARKRGLCVVQTEGQLQVCIYRPFAVTVTDIGMGVCRGVLTDTWTSDDSEISSLDLGGMTDEDDADDVATAIRDAFIAAATENMQGADEDAEYDAHENGLSVTVTPMTCVID